MPSPDQGKGISISTKLTARQLFQFPSYRYHFPMITLRAAAKTFADYAHRLATAYELAPAFVRDDHLIAANLTFIFLPVFGCHIVSPFQIQC